MRPLHYGLYTCLAYDRKKKTGMASTLEAPFRRMKPHHARQARRLSRNAWSAPTTRSMTSGGGIRILR